MANTFHLSVITPERVVFQAEATFAAIPAHDGEIGILPSRAPLVAKLGVGWLRVDTPEDSERILIDGGFVQVLDNRVSVLTEFAQEPQEIDHHEARKALDVAAGLPMFDDAAFRARERAMARARAQLKVADMNLKAAG